MWICNFWFKKAIGTLPTHCIYEGLTILTGRSQWLRGLRRRSTAARLPISWVRIPTGGAWMFVFCECCVLSGRGLCDGLITRPEESYRLWCVVVCDLETSWMRRAWPTGGLSLHGGGGLINKNATKVSIVTVTDKVFSSWWNIAKHISKWQITNVSKHGHHKAFCKGKCGIWNLIFVTKKLSN